MLSHERSSAQSNRAKHLLECVSSATSIIAIFDLFCKSFGIYRSVLSLSYSVYIASSIFLLQVQAAAGSSGVLTEEQQQQQQPALRKLDFCIRALSRLKDINPIVGSAVSLILRELANLGMHASAANFEESQTAAATARQQQQHMAHQAATAYQQPPHQPHPHQHTPSLVASGFRARHPNSTPTEYGHRFSHHEIMMGNTAEVAALPGFGSPDRTPPSLQQGLFQCPQPDTSGDKVMIDHHLQHHGISNQVFEAVSSLQPISASFGNMGAVQELAHGLPSEYRS